MTGELGVVQAERTLAAADRALAAAEALAAVRACPRAQYVAELTAGVAGGPGWLAYRAEQATRLRALALSATGWAGRWDDRADHLAASWWGEAPPADVQARLAQLDSAARTAQVVCEARLARAAKMA